jgi:hypothetical protein
MNYSPSALPSLGDPAGETNANDAPAVFFL